jgi:mRNA interferase MazF
MASVRINISLPEDAFKELSKHIEPSKRSRFIGQAVKKGLKDLKKQRLAVPNMKRWWQRSSVSTRSSKEPFRMVSINRGDIFLVNFDPPVGPEAKKIRPAAVVSNDINNAHSPIVSITPITSNVDRVCSFEVEIPSRVGGLKSRSKVMVNQTRAVDKMRLVKRLGHLPEQIMAGINQAL